MGSPCRSVVRRLQESRARAAAEGQAAAAHEELEVERGGSREARRAAAAARPQIQQLRTDAAAAKAAASAAEEARDEARAELDALSTALRQTRSTYLACAQARPPLLCFLARVAMPCALRSGTGMLPPRAPANPTPGTPICRCVNPSGGLT